MKDTKRVTRMIGTTLAATIFLGSCSIGLTPDTAGPEEDLERLDAELNLTANSAVEAAEAQLAASSEIGPLTTYNNPGMDPVTVVGTTDAVDLPARSDYPYPGWTTTGTVKHIADPDSHAAIEGWDTAEYDWTTPLGTNNLFKVTATAKPDVDLVNQDVYPERAVDEVYYVQSADDAYDSDTDFIFDPYGYAGSGYRDEYVAEYSDGSTRDHWIIADDDTTYEAFDVNATLDFDSSLASGTTTGSAVYSSATMYTHELGETFNYWFWNNNDDVTPYIVGTRYYTEHVVEDAAGNEYVGTSLTFEYTYDNSWQEGDETPRLLARTIIREEMRFAYANGEVGDATAHTLRLQTEINNTSGGDGLVYTRQGKSLADWGRRGGGNPAEAQLAGIQRETLPANFGDIGEFAVTIDSLDPVTE